MKNGQIKISARFSFDIITSIFSYTHKETYQYVV